MITTSLPSITLSFGEVLAKLRTDAGLTAPDLAPEVDMSERTIRNYETGTQFPKRSTVILWAHATNYPFVDELLETWADARQEWEASRKSGCVYAWPPNRLFDDDGTVVVDFTPDYAQLEERQS